VKPPLLPLLLAALLPLAALHGEDRFPQPEFTTAYKAKAYQHPAPRGTAMEWVDVAVLLGALALASTFALSRRRKAAVPRRRLAWLEGRLGLYALMLFCLLYFGFYRQGCICPVGSVQNVTAALAGAGYVVPITVILFFALPLVFALFFGRVFCASVCPLGAMQDLVALRPMKIPRALSQVLGVLPWAYLAVAVLFAATGTSWIICRLDPFVSFFRLSGDLTRILLGVLFLGIGLVVARPYCRFLCPYGALLGLASRLSWKKVTVTPRECVQCRLCEHACPFDAIEKPEAPVDAQRPRALRRTGWLLAATPIWIALGAFLFWNLAPSIAHHHNTVFLSQRVRIEDRDPSLPKSWETRIWRELGKSEEELHAQAGAIRSRLQTGALFAGGFIGLVFGLTLVGLSRRVVRKDWEPDPAKCLACGRCFAYCPVEYQNPDSPDSPTLRGGDKHG